VDTLVHLAFLSRPTHNTSWAHELEAIGTLHLLNACAACKVHKVVMWSLSALYGANPDNPNLITEQQQPHGAAGSHFFDDRLEAERLARRYRNENPGAVVTILRTAHILGRNQDNYVARFLRKPMVPTLMGHDPLVQLLHEEDAVAVFKLAVDGEHNGSYNVASAGVLPLRTMLAMAGTPPLPVPHFWAYPLIKVMWLTQVLDVPPVYLDFLRYLCVVDTEKVRREMGFVARYTIQDIVREFAGTQEQALAGAGPSAGQGGFHGA
jgi:UDP-glucose 4-epimerase